MKGQPRFRRGAPFVVVTLIFFCMVRESRADFHAGAVAYEKKDYVAAFSAFRASAQRGNVASQSMIGGMYLHGQGVAEDPKAAAVWYKKASRQGSLSAQYALAQMYYSGIGVPQDAVRAAQLYEKAADKGLIYAMYTIGVMYSRGEGVHKDLVQAYKWLNLTASYSLTPETTEYINAANTARTKIEPEMTPAQIQQAQVLAMRWDEARKVRNAQLEKKIKRPLQKAGQGAPSRKPAVKAGAVAGISGGKNHSKMERPLQKAEQGASSHPPAMAAGADAGISISGGENHSAVPKYQDWRSHRYPYPSTPEP